jgi:hypothetical protein
MLGASDFSDAVSWSPTNADTDDLIPPEPSAMRNNPR